MFNGIVPDKPRSDCPVCHGKGFVASNSDDYFVAGYCSCVAGQQTSRRVERAGFGGAFARYTFDSFRMDRPWHRDAVLKARAYAKKPDGWFVITGNSGTGKTHLCTAICQELIGSGHSVRYEVWRTLAPKLKSLVGSEYSRYERKMTELCNVGVLYLDDFFKGRVGDADINFAFELLNDRYNSARPTILSTELSLEDILKLDEAIGSRIVECSKGFLVKTPPENYRLRHA